MYCNIFLLNPYLELTQLCLDTCIEYLINNGTIILFNNPLILVDAALSSLTNLGIVAADTTTCTGVIVVVDDLIVPQLCHSSVVCLPGGGDGQVLTNIEKGWRLLTPE